MNSYGRYLKPWNVDPTKWPGWDKDMISNCGARALRIDSPTGRRTAVIYAFREVGLGREAGFLSLLDGPPETPSTQLFVCDVCFNYPPMWIEGDRLLCVGVYVQGKNEPHLARCLFDLAIRRYTLFPRYYTVLKKQSLVIAELPRYLLGDQGGWEVIDIEILTWSNISDISLIRDKFINGYFTPKTMRATT
jgi:hypothetical protein